MSYSSCTGELQYDLEVEKKARRLRKEAKLRKQVSSYLSLELDLVVDSVDSSSNTETKQEMANAEITLRELATPNENQQPSAFSIQL